jgi:hypothetical protein
VKIFIFRQYWTLWSVTQDPDFINSLKQKIMKSIQTNNFVVLCHSAGIFTTLLINFLSCIFVKILSLEKWAQEFGST